MIKAIIYIKQYLIQKVETVFYYLLSEKIKEKLLSTENEESK